jgi:hypothetical protein
MILELTYAKFVAAVLGGMVAFTPADHPQADTSNYILSVGTNAPEKSPVGQDGFITLEHRPKNELFWGLKPVHSIGVSVDGAAFVGFGVRQDYHWKNLQITPFFGPVLYQKSLGNFNSKELIQFRTGFDVMYNVNKNIGVGVGVYHMSNAGLTSQSAGIDVTRFLVRINY